MCFYFCLYFLCFYGYKHRVCVYKWAYCWGKKKKKKELLTYLPYFSVARYANTIVFGPYSASKCKGHTFTKSSHKKTQKGDFCEMGTWLSPGNYMGSTRPLLGGTKKKVKSSIFCHIDLTCNCNKIVPRKLSCDRPLGAGGAAALCPWNF